MQEHKSETNRKLVMKNFLEIINSDRPNTAKASEMNELLTRISKVNEDETIKTIELYCKAYICIENFTVKEDGEIEEATKILSEIKEFISSNSIEGANIEEEMKFYVISIQTKIFQFSHHLMSPEEKIAKGEHILNEIDTCVVNDSDLLRVKGFVDYIESEIISTLFDTEKYKLAFQRAKVILKNFSEPEIENNIDTAEIALDCLIHEKNYEEAKDLGAKLLNIIFDSENENVDSTNAIYIRVNLMLANYGLDDYEYVRNVGPTLLESINKLQTEEPDYGYSDTEIFDIERKINAAGVLITGRDGFSVAKPAEKAIEVNTANRVR